MKKLSFLSLVAAGLLMASCSQEDIVGPAAGDGNYHITVTLPGNAAATRAFGNGLTANNLNYAVYDAANYNLVYTSSTTFNGDNDGDDLKTTVPFNLVKGKSYYIAFFAQSAASETNEAYKFDAEAGTITVDYDAMATTYNTDIYDCFFQVYTTGVIGDQAQSTTITLYRPVAQINWGTNDIDEGTVTNTNAYGASAQYLVSKVELSAYTTFNMLAFNESNEMVGDVSGATTTVTFPNLARPAATETFPVPNYDYVSMQYVLAPKASTVYDLTLTISNPENPAVATNPSNLIQNVINVSSAPVQANYRTNIFGSLLTDNVDFVVVKSPDWETPDNNIGPWDGVTATSPTIDDATSTAVVSRPSDLMGLANLVNGKSADGESTATPMDFEDFVITLSGDIDMGGHEFPGIGSISRSSSNANGTSFRGTFDGNGKTISNLVINGTTSPTDAAAFIGNLDGEGAELKNVTFENITINAPQNEQVGVVGMLTNGAKVDGVTVTSGTITAAEGAGGIVGRMTYSGTITNCNNGATINTGTNGGGIVGAAYYTADGSVCTISNCNNTGNVTGTSNAIGGIVGLSCAEVTGCNNSGTIKGNTSSVGGIVGEQKSAGNVTGCVNTGNINADGSNAGQLGAGGIVGWVRYENGSAYSRQNLITVTGCTNYGSVSAASKGTGGIVGTWYMCGDCSNNKNFAPTIKGASFVAGIVGDSQWVGTQPDGFTEGANLLTVNDNQSSTLTSDMTGSLAEEFVYINDTAKTTQSGNEMVEPQTAPQN